MQQMPRTVLLILPVILAGCLAAELPAAQPTTVPPLPQGAYPEWNLARAWRVDSSKRERICVNGLWRFRSETKLGVRRTIFQDGFENPKLAGWKCAQLKPGTWKAVIDQKVKYSGRSGLCMTFDLPRETDFFHFRRQGVKIRPGSQYHLSIRVKSQIESGSMAIEVQDARSYKYFVARTKKFSGIPRWKIIKLDFTTPKTTRAISIYVRHYREKEAFKGRVWLDELKLEEQPRVDYARISPPRNRRWGFIKVPGSWKERVYWHRNDPMKQKNTAVNWAWYEREAKIPATWKGRSIQLCFDRIATDAVVYCNGRFAGSLPYLGGNIDITRLARPGQVIKIAVLVHARNPADVLAPMGGDKIRRWRPYKQKLSNCGINGNVYLESKPAAFPRVGPFLIITRTKDRQMRVRVDLRTTADSGAPEGLVAMCEIRDQDQVVKTFQTRISAGAKQVILQEKWEEAVLWEPDNPKLYTMQVSLLQNDKIIDQSLPQTFGFREFAIRGKFFYLNNIKINLRPCSYCGFYPQWRSRKAMERWLRTTRAQGYNFVYTATTDFPGKCAWIKQFLEICDRIGMLAAVTPPQINLFWDKLDQTETWNAWTTAVQRRVTSDWNHPSLVLWRTHMNFCGYHQDQNPLMMDGHLDPPPESTQGRKFKAAAMANAFIRKLDPTRGIYVHASGNAGEIYTINCYLGWPQLQDLREWLHVWAARGTKPLMMAEFDVPYPGSCSMNDNTSWWMNEPLMTEYGAILLGEKSYALEDDDFVDFSDWAWDRKTKKWRSAYGYFCSAFPPILDQCSSIFYRTVVPAWRTWGISGGLNSWENTGRRLIKRVARPGEPWRMRAVPPEIPVATDWEHLQQPGFFPDTFKYARGGGGEIRCNFDPGLPLEKEYFQPTLRGRTMREITRPLYAYIAGPGRDWPAQDHGFYAGEKIAKSVILINDLRRACTFTIKWEAKLDGRVIAGGKAALKVAAAEHARAAIEFAAPETKTRICGRLTAVVSVNGKTLPVAPFAIQVWPRLPAGPVLPDTSGWALYDPTGRTAKSFARAGVNLPLIDGRGLPQGIRVLVIGETALSTETRPGFVRTLAQKVREGLQVLFMAQSGDTLSRLFTLRTVTRGERRLWIRDRAHAVLAGLDNTDLADWRGQTSLGPLDKEPDSAIVNQRWKRVWRCSLRGTVSSCVVEKPHVSNFRPLLDCGFDLRYMALWEEFEGKGRVFFCQLDLADRLGKDPAADLLARNLLRNLQTWKQAAAARMSLVAGSPQVLADFLPLRLAGEINPTMCPPGNRSRVVIMTRGSFVWMVRNARALGSFLAGGGTLVAAGLSRREAEVLASITNSAFTVAMSENVSRNPLGTISSSVFRGVGPAAIHWRERKTVPIVKSVAGHGWRSPTGVLADIPVNAGRIVWLSVMPSDFDPGKRPDLVFTRVNVSRLYALVLVNLGVQSHAPWLTCLATDPAPSVHLPEMWRARTDPKRVGMKQGWMRPETDDTKAPWRDVMVPGMWGTVAREWLNYDGDVWYRVHFKVPEQLRTMPLEFYAGAIDDTDEVFLNGEKIGETTTNTPRWWITPRHYPLPAHLLQKDGRENILAVRINDHFQDGGFLGPVQIRLPLADEDLLPIRLYLDRRKPRDDPYAYMRW